MICDLNCDMGEETGSDGLLMPLISSANISCGLHAGNAQVINATCRLALENNVYVGAHPSFDDRENFGRKEITLSPEDVYQLVLEQITTFKRIVELNGTTVHHVKPHGALYNMAARDPDLAKGIAKAVKDVDPSIIIYGLANSFLIRESAAAGLQVRNEVFADRAYNNDGSLVSRTKAYAMHQNSEQVVRQVFDMVTKKIVIAHDGTEVPVIADTICLHGDGKLAYEFAIAINKMFVREGIVKGSKSI